MAKPKYLNVHTKVIVPLWIACSVMSWELSLRLSCGVFRQWMPFFFFHLMYSGRKAVFNKAFESIALIEHKRDIYRHCTDPESIGFIYVCIHISTRKKVLQKIDKNLGIQCLMFWGTIHGNIFCMHNTKILLNSC